MNPEETTKTEKPKTPNIYKMKLHEKIIVRDMDIIKVPGGWIYRIVDEDIAGAVFVPYHNEFFCEQQTP